MTDRLIRIGSGTFCRVQDLKAGDVIRLIAPCGTVARVSARNVPDGEINGISVSRIEYGEIVDLPEPQDGVVYIVSMLKVDLSEMDFYAFVALDILQIAYVPIHLLRGTDRVSVLQCIEFRSEQHSRAPSSLPRKGSRSMRFFEDFAKFPLAQAEYCGFRSVDKNKSVSAINLSLWDQGVGA